MLVLTRKLGERITIGDEIVITVLDVKASHVKLGVQAPKGISVHRGEVYERIQEENLLAAGTETGDFAAAEKLYHRKDASKGKAGRK